MSTRTIHLPATCPEEPGHREVCARCLKDRLLVTPGIRSVSMRPEATDGLATVELDYDPRLLTLSELDVELKRAGACLSKDRAEVVLGIDGMVSPRSEQVIESALSRLPGVVASASFASRSLRIGFDRKQCALPEIVRRLDELGLRVRQPGTNRQSAEPQAAQKVRIAWHWIVEYHKLAMALIGGLLLLGAVVVRFTDGPHVLRYVLVGASAIIAGWYTAKDTFQVLRQFHFDIDVLMFAAAIGAAALGKFEEGAFLLVLFALGGAGEEIAMDRARRAIEALAKLAPETATVRDRATGADRLVRIADVHVGDLVVVRPFDRVPSDGVVESGASAIDQSPITGESIPVEKTAGSPVFAGTINGEGLLLVSVTKLSTESTLAKVVRMVEEAQTTKSPTQVFTDQVERWYVPFVLIATSVLIVVPPLFLGARSVWFYRAMAFLTAASPCALAIGTPAAVLSGIARAARIGVLVKGGVHLENLGRVQIIAFDKTGTLTAGKPQVTDVVALDESITENELLALSAAVEQVSTHPLARAIVGEARARECRLPETLDAQQVPGQGVCATIGGRRITVGRAEMFDPAKLNGDAAAVLSHIETLAQQGKSIVVVGIDDRPVGVIALADRPRANAAQTLNRLRALGITRTIMLTGDNSAVAASIAREVGADEFHAELLPENKLDLVRQLQLRHGPLAMVGDGVNDAPALATASVGIAMGGAAATDVALETADVALMADDLRKLPDAIALSRFSRRIIKQNLTIALGVIAILAPLSALGYAYLGVAVLFHEGSTVVVVLNSLRLLMYKPPRG
jgi:Cd2+/Zn2+-exporting ATPase